MIKNTIELWVKLNVDKTVWWASVIREKSQSTVLKYCAKMIIKTKGLQIC